MGRWFLLRINCITEYYHTECKNILIYFLGNSVRFFCFGVLCLFLASIQALTPRKTNKPGFQNKILKVGKLGQGHTEMLWYGGRHMIKKKSLNQVYVMRFYFWTVSINETFPCPSSPAYAICLFDIPPPLVTSFKRSQVTYFMPPTFWPSSPLQPPPPPVPSGSPYTSYPHSLTSPRFREPLLHSNHSPSPLQRKICLVSAHPLPLGLANPQCPASVSTLFVKAGLSYVLGLPLPSV